MNTTKVPTESEIAQAEKYLAELKQAREEAKSFLLSSLKSDNLLASLGREELLGLVKKLQSKLSNGHKKVRGSPVPSDLKAAIIKAIQEDHMSLSQMSAMFNVSISYISKIKSELRKRVVNAYTDFPLTTSKREPATA